MYPTVNGATDASRPKADLGDGTNGWHFDVTLHNVSDTPATYELSSQALSENIEGGFFTGHSTDWNGKGVSVSFSNNSVTSPAKGRGHRWYRRHPRQPVRPVGERERPPRAPP